MTTLLMDVELTLCRHQIVCNSKHYTTLNLLHGKLVYSSTCWTQDRIEQKVLL